MLLDRKVLTRVGVVLVIMLCCAPLFFGLGQADLENDEAAYSFSVERILETGDWLIPRISPSEDQPLLEKPPLKMWIVAATLRAGLLPDNECGLRVWDVLFGGAVFIYVFFLALRQSNVVGGISAAMMLFVHVPLLVGHGLRSNNLEAALVLSYAGGMYHFLCWSDAPGTAPGRRHLMVLALYCAFGFMIKFVAILFLPAIIGVSARLSRPARSALVVDWRAWAAAAALALLLASPWYVYASVRYGALFWHVILGTHIYQRFTAYVDPAHLQPWSFYFSQLYTWLARTSTLWPVALGLGILCVRSARSQVDAIATLTWFAVPIAALSLGTSKLYHYLYPFIPPLAIAGGVAVASIMQVALEWVPVAFEPRHMQVRQPAIRRFCLSVALVAFVVALLTLLHGPIELTLAGRRLFKNGALIRPALIMVAFGVLGGWRRLAPAAVALIVLAVLPLPFYRSFVPELWHGAHPLRAARDCIVEAQQRPPAAAAPGLLVDAPIADLAHPPYYYFRRIRPWEHAGADGGAATLRDERLARPIVMTDSRYRELLRHGVLTQDAAPSLRIDKLRLILPAFYEPCVARIDDSR